MSTLLIIAVSVGVLVTLTLIVLIAMMRQSMRSLHQRNEQLGGMVQLLTGQLTQLNTAQATGSAQLTERLDNAFKNVSTTVATQLQQDRKLAGQTQQLIAQRLDKTSTTVGDVREQLGKLDQAAQRIVQVGKEVRQLQDILQHPKLRGGLGEWSLENLLQTILPTDHYHLQHRFADGQIVDALITLADGTVSIDAKFPLAQFQTMLDAPDPAAADRARRGFFRDACKHIDAIAEKYIQPQAGTLDFALMFVPAENVYYEMLAYTDPIDVCAYGRDRKVMVVSPNTLYAYLMAIGAGLRGLRIERHARAIHAQLAQFAGDMERFVQQFAVVGKHLHNTVNRYDDAAGRLEQFALRLNTLRSGADDASELQ